MDDAAKIDGDPLELILAFALALDEVEHHNNRVSPVCHWLLYPGLLALISWIYLLSACGVIFAGSYFIIGDVFCLPCGHFWFSL